MIHTTEEVVLRIGRRLCRFADVDHERCEACGERIFGIAASQRFDVALPKRRSQRAA